MGGEEYEDPKGGMGKMDKLFYTRREAAHEWHICISSVDVLIHTGQVKVIRKGRKVIIPRSQIERIGRKTLGRIWPPKSASAGKTSRHFQNPRDKKSPVKAQLDRLGPHSMIA
jgi:hypothetical protein